MSSTELSSIVSQSPQTSTQRTAQLTPTERLAVMMQAEEEAHRRQQRLLFEQIMSSTMEKLHLPSIAALAECMVRVEMTQSAQATDVNEAVHKLIESNNLHQRNVRKLLVITTLLVMAALILGGLLLMGAKPKVLPQQTLSEVPTLSPAQMEVMRAQAQQSAELKSEIASLTTQRDALKADIVNKGTELAVATRTIQSLTATQREVTTQLEGLVKLNQAYQFRLLTGKQGVFCRVPSGVKPFVQEGDTYILVQEAAQ